MSTLKRVFHPRWFLILLAMLTIVDATLTGVIIYMDIRATNIQHINEIRGECHSAEIGNRPNGPQFPKGELVTIGDRHYYNPPNLGLLEANSFMRFWINQNVAIAIGIKLFVAFLCIVLACCDLGPKYVILLAPITAIYVAVIAGEIALISQYYHVLNMAFLANVSLLKKGF